MSKRVCVTQITAVRAVMKHALHSGPLPYLLLNERTLLPFMVSLYGLKGGVRPDAQAPQTS
jgi:hypothetical protein